MRRAKRAKEFYLRNIFCTLCHMDHLLPPRMFVLGLLTSPPWPDFFFISNLVLTTPQSFSLPCDKPKFLSSVSCWPQEGTGGEVGGWLILPQSLSIVTDREAQWKDLGRWNGSSAFPKWLQQFHWFSRYKHLAVKINKLLYPYNYRVPLQMQLKWIPAHLECCDDVSKWSFLLF